MERTSLLNVTGADSSGVIARIGAVNAAIPARKLPRTTNLNDMLGSLSDRLCFLAACSDPYTLARGGNGRRIVPSEAFAIE
jgi:hypothetical protein